jgi:hypothetical protein
VISGSCVAEDGAGAASWAIALLAAAHSISQLAPIWNVLLLADFIVGS